MVSSICDIVFTRANIHVYSFFYDIAFTKVTLICFFLDIGKIIDVTEKTEDETDLDIKKN